MQFKTYEEYEKFIKEFVTDTMLNKLIYEFLEKDELDILIEIFASYLGKELPKKMLSWLSKKFYKNNITFISNLSYCIDKKESDQDIKYLDRDRFGMKRNKDTLKVIYDYKIDEINKVNSYIIKKALANQQLAKAKSIK